MSRRFLRITSAFSLLLLVAWGCRHQAPAALPPVADEATRLEGALATALMQRDSLALDRFLAPGFVLLATDRRLPPVPRSTWLASTLKEIRLDSVAVREVTGAWAGDTLTTVFWLYYRGKSGDKVIPPEEAHLQDRWLLEGSRWQLLSRRTLEWRPGAAATAN